MDVTEEEYYEDEDGYKRKRRIRVERGSGTHKDRFVEEITHLECSPQFINDVVSPRVEAVIKQREREAEGEEINRQFEEWKKEKFGQK